VATLNLRDRLIEAKIAYVGASFGGKSTNLEHLLASPRDARCGAPSEDGGVSWFEWRPSNVGKFDDCEVSVRVIAPSGGDVAEVTSADGVVLVVDSDPAALDRNRRAANALRDELRGRDVPVVVQLNKRDLPHALPEDRLVAALALDDWPRISANAAAGEGVIETLERAIEGVLRMMTDVPRNGTTRPTESNPLLAALRGVLESAIAEQMRALEARLEERLVARIDQRLDAQFASGKLEGRLLDQIDQRLQSLVEARKDLAAIKRELATQAQKMESLASQQLRACSKDDLILESGRRAVALEANLQKQRDQILASLGAFQRTIDAATADQRKFDQQANAKLAALVTDTSDSVLAALSPISVEMAKVARIEQHAESTASAIDEMRDQLEKRKKGWFG
jgi:hypothetical protein